MPLRTLAPFELDAHNVALLLKVTRGPEHPASVFDLLPPATPEILSAGYNAHP
jgi:hypothetical protein